MADKNTKDIVTRLLKEKIGGHAKAPIATKSAVSDDASSSSKYDQVKKLLDNDIFNHSAIIRQLWGDDDATNRSLFRKKLNKEANDTGSTYEFDDEELQKIVTILMATSSQIRKTVGRNGKA